MNPTTSSTTPRARALFAGQCDAIAHRTDRLFAVLMPFQWFAAICFAIFVSPRTWAGEASGVHPHVWAALLLGGALTSMPVLLALTRPGHGSTRHVIAVAQMLMSALLIHLTGGRVETHFHIFGSLAFLAFYRDWRVLVTASAVVALDHLMRGIYWPLSVFGVLTASPWRALEHAGWVIFEDLFLMISIRQGIAEMAALAGRQATLEETNATIELQVAERTADLTHEIAERKLAEAATEDANRQLRDLSREAGMAEVATSVLHNVGNVLNSVNISVDVATDKLRRSKLATVGRLATMLREQKDLATFLTTDPRGAELPAFLGTVTDRLESDRAGVLAELASLRGNIEHINEIVAMQQSYAKACGVIEVLPLAEVIEDALRLNATAIARHALQIVRDFAELPPAPVDRHKVLQILVNLIRNAKYALDDGGASDKRLTLRLSFNGGGCAKISVSDNGVGIPAENLTRMFHHGFTTRKTGHGFGLHSGALAAKELGGSLRAHSDGPGRGATFTLEIPFQPAARPS